MNKFVKLAFALLFSILFLLVGFYLWASSPKHSNSEYAKIEQFQFPSKINNDSVFSIITYNIGYLSGMTNNLAIEKSKQLFDTNLSQVLKFFQKENADILAFQEIDFGSTRSFEINQQNKIAEIGYNNIAQTINWDKNYVPFPESPISMHFGKMLSGQSILSKYPILFQERIPLQRNSKNPFYYDAFYLERLAQIVKIKVKNHILVIINVHLEAYDAETRIKQTKKVIELYNKYSIDFPTILLGDFNSDISYANASIKLIMDIPQIGNAVFTENNLVKTFSSEKPTERLDYIFYNTHFIEFIDGSVLNEFGQASDHLPLKMLFRIKLNNSFQIKPVL